MAETQEAKQDLYAQARVLIGQARAASLATVTQGAPFAALVTPAFLPDLSAILLLSQLSAHTKHLAENPACALLVTGQPATENPQTAPRICLSGAAAVDPDPATRETYLKIHPYAAQYADFTDFAFWRLRFTSAHFIGGFAAASRLDILQLAQT